MSVTVAWTHVLGGKERVLHLTRSFPESNYLKKRLKVHNRGNDDGAYADEYPDSEGRTDASFRRTFRHGGL